MGSPPPLREGGGSGLANIGQIQTSIPGQLAFPKSFEIALVISLEQNPSSPIRMAAMQRE